MDSAALAEQQPPEQTPQSTVPALRNEVSVGSLSVSPVAGPVRRPPALTGAQVLRSQAGAGNAAVARLIARETSAPADPALDSEAIFAELTEELGLEAQRVSESTPAQNAQAAIDAGFVDEQGRGLHGQGAPGELTGPRVEGGVQPHKEMREVRETFGHSGSAYQSAHVVPSSFMDQVPQYSRGDAQTVLMPAEIHRFLDDFWKRWAREQLPLRAEEKCTVAEMHAAMQAAIANLDQMPNADPQQIRSLQAILAVRLDAEVSALDLPLDAKVWLPWAKKKQA